SAAHVVADPYADVSPDSPAAVDWDATLAFRRLPVVARAGCRGGHGHRAGLAPGDVDLVFADALGTAEADAAEAAVLARLLPDVPVTAPKAGFGRAYAGAGALDLAAAVLALEQGFVPPTPWPDPDEPVLEELAGRLVRGAGPAAAPRTALVLSRGFGGACSAAVLARAGHPLPPVPAAA
ncbi:DUF993 family protein, partial [Streptomyces sp. NPDC006307]|uniref:DUF993 family protein n=1 Tax=Streptomyces sp. NPDC006307 TaxID=3156748 RepID=UPI0033BB77EB